MTRRSVRLLINPSAGGKLASGPTLAADASLLVPDALTTALRGLGLRVEPHVLGKDDDITALAGDAAATGHDVVAAGGDGTVSRAAIGLLGTDAALGILALGSFNNMAHGFGVPRSLDAALEVIRRGESSLMDVGLARHHEADEPRIFFEAAGVGLDAEGFGAIELTERRGWLRGARALLRALRHRQRAMRLTIDGREQRTRAPAITVCNGPYLGMGFALAADADPADGLLDVVVFAGMSRFEVLRHFGRVARGARRHEPRLRIVRAREVRVQALRGVLPAHADGGSMGTTPVIFRVRPAALRVFR